MRSLKSLPVVLALAQKALAHYKWPALIVDGAITPDFKYVRENTNNINPLLDLNSVDLRCNEGGLASGPKTSTATVKAGSKVTQSKTTECRASINSITGWLHTEQQHWTHWSHAGIHGQGTRGSSCLGWVRQRLVQDQRMGPYVL